MQIKNNKFYNEKDLERIEIKLIELIAHIYNEFNLTKNQKRLIKYIILMGKESLEREMFKTENKLSILKSTKEFHDIYSKKVLDQINE